MDRTEDLLGIGVFRFEPDNPTGEALGRDLPALPNLEAQPRIEHFDIARLTFRQSFNLRRSTR